MDGEESRTALLEHPDSPHSHPPPVVAPAARAVNPWPPAAAITPPAPPLPAKPAATTMLRRRIAAAIYLSLAANVLLLVVKAGCFIFSGSMAVLASAVDSLIDLASQAVISFADWQMSRRDVRYPAGKARLEPISVIWCAFIMTVGALLVVQESVQKLVAGVRTGVLPTLELSPVMFGILGAAVAVKLVLWWYCVALRHQSGAAEALAEDHLNDVWSNAGAIITAAVAAADPQRLWWVDPAGGVLISLVIVWRWAAITRSAVAKVVGVGAAPDILDLIRSLAEEHHPQAQPAFLRAYHVGQRLAVDCELEAPGGLSIVEAAAISQALKQKLEELPEVEAASVVVVPEGTHTSPSRPTLLLPEPVSKPPAVHFLAEMPAGGSTAAAIMTAASWRHRDDVAPSGPRDAEAAGGASASIAPATAAPLPTPFLRRVSAPALLHPSTQQLAAASSSHAEEQAGSPRPSTYAEQFAWMRGLRDRPDHALRSTSFQHRDTPCRMLARSLAGSPAGSPRRSNDGAASSGDWP